MLALDSVVVAIALACSGLPDCILPQQKPDPPKHVEGICKEVVSAPFARITVTVREMAPTDREDVIRPVDRDYGFLLAPSIRVFAIDGKPDSSGIRAIKPGMRVRLETKENSATEVRILPTNEKG
jgi:hypothetical protein